MSARVHGIGLLSCLLLALVSFALTGCGFVVNSTNQPTPTVASFTSSALIISAGDSVTLSWSVTESTSLAIDHGVGPVSGTSVIVKPAQTTTYTLTATNSMGSTTATVTVTVRLDPSAPEIASFSASPSTITAGDNVTLSWSVTNATSLTIDNGVGTVTGTSVVVKPTQTTTYTLTAKNSAGNTTATATVTVHPAAGPPEIASFNASPSTITSGDSVTLTWSVANATSVAIDNGVGTVTGTSIIVKPTQTTTYTLTATNSADSQSQVTTAAVTVTVVTAPTIISFKADNLLLTPATSGPVSSTLSWEVTGAPRLSIDNNVGTVTGTSVTVTPTATTTYTLTAANSIGGTSTATVTIKVRSVLAALDGTAYAGTNRTEYLSNRAYYGSGMGVCQFPYFLASDSAGNIYATDTNLGAICKITPTGAVTVLASNAGAGYFTYASGSGGIRAMSAHLSDGLRKPATAATHASPAMVNAGLYYPTGIAVSSDGNTVYFADSYNNRIRKITIASDGTSMISDVAGGNPGRVDGPGFLAEFIDPQGLALDGAGNLYVADYGNYVIRKITFAADGSSTVSTLAGDGNNGYADGDACTAEFGFVEGLAASADGKSIYVSEFTPAGYWSFIRKISTDSNQTVTVSTVAGGQAGYEDGDNTTAQFSASLGELALSADGTTLYAGDQGNSVVRKIAMATDGTSAITTAAGEPYYWGHADGAADAAWFQRPFGVALDPTGNLYISDNFIFYGTATTLRKLAPATGDVSTIVLNIFANTGGSADGTGTQAGFNIPTAVVSDSNGDLYVADTANSTVRKIAFDTDGNSTVSTFAGTAGVYGSADGTGATASFDQPSGLAIDTAANVLYVADSENGTLRKIDLPSGAVTTLGTAGDHSVFGYPWRLAIDSNGLIYVADEWGIVSTADPGTGDVQPFLPVDSTNGLFTSGPITGLAVFTSQDKSQSYLYASGSCAVFRVDLLASPLTVTTIAGTSVCGYQNGAAKSALFADIRGLSVDSQGNLYVVDTENSVIRRITPNGNVSTVAGSYPSTMMRLGSLPGSLYLPLGVALDPSDNLLITVPNAVLSLVP